MVALTDFVLFFLLQSLVLTAVHRLFLWHSCNIPILYSTSPAPPPQLLVLRGLMTRRSWMLLNEYEYLKEWAQRRNTFRTVWKTSISFFISRETFQNFSADLLAAVFLPRDALVHSAVLRLHVVRLSVRLSVCLSVCLSVTLVDQDHIGWKSWKLIARSIRPTPSLFVAQRPST